MATKTAAWPIRVGGHYMVKNREPLVFIVDSIDGDMVYFHHFEASNFPENQHYGHMAFDSDGFRYQALPEDQSPIPALVEALILARNLLKSLQPDCDCVTCRKIAAALELAGA